MRIKKIIWFLSFLICIELICFGEVKVYEYSHPDGCSLTLFGENIKVVSRKSTIIEIEGNQVSLEYTKGKYSGNDSSYSTVLYIGEELIESDVYKTIRNSNFTIKLNANGGNRSGSSVRTVLDLEIRFNYVNPDVSLTSFIIDKNQQEQIKKKYKSIFNYETIADLEGASYGSYYVNGTVESGHLYNYESNLYAAPKTKIRFNMNNMNSSSSSSGTTSGSYSFSKTALYINDTEYTKSEYTFSSNKNEEITISWKHLYGGGGGGIDGSGNMSSSSSSYTDVLWSCKIKIGESGLNDDGTGEMKTISQNNWIQLNDKIIMIKVCGTDSSGISEIKSSVGECIYGESGTAYVFLNDTGEISVKIDVINEIEIVTSRNLTFYVDSTSPDVSCIIENDLGTSYTEGEWVKGKLKVQIIVSDEQSGIKTGLIKVENEDTKEITEHTLTENIEFELENTGKYEITGSVTNNAGLTTDLSKKEVFIDNEKPVFPEQELYSKSELIFTEGKVSGIRVPIRINDENSGIAKYSIFMEINGEEITIKNSEQIEEFTIGCTEISYDEDCNISIDRTIGNKIKVYINAEDRAKNAQQFDFPEIYIPSLRDPLSNGDSVIEGEEIYTKIVVYPDFEKEYGQNVKYSYTRDLYNDGTVVNGSENLKIISLYEKEDVREYESFIGEKTISFENAAKFEEILDRVSIKTGFGHKKICYRITQEYEAWGKNYTESLTPIDVMFANCNPEIKLVIEGIEEDGSIRSDFIDMKNIPKKWDMTLPKSGVVNMGVQIFDYDIEEYKVELSQVKDIKFTDSDEYIEMHIPVAGATLAGQIVYAGPEKKRVFKSDSLNKEEEYNLFPNPILLNFNTYTKYVLRVKEGTDEEKDTEAIVFHTEYSENGLILKVEDGNYNANGITAQVNSEVKFNVKAEDGSSGGFTWDFGDGAKENNVSETSHTYQQSKNRKDGESLYKLKIQNDKGNEAEINVHIMDTEYGPMKGDEKWVGKHFVRGEVVVPGGKTLTFGAEDLEAPDPIILSYGAQNKEKRGKITVCAGGFIKSENKGNVIFSEMKNTDKGFFEIEDEREHTGWGGITAETGSKVTLKDCEMRYADIALTAAGNGTDVNLDEVYIHGNNVGIHVLDGTRVEIQNSNISGNTKYGIKEDGEKTEVIYRNGNNKLEGNGSTEYFRNFYDVEEALINIE